MDYTLDDFFREYPKIAIAFSGGTDSSYLLYEAMAHGADVKAYFVKGAFQPVFELEDALKLADKLGADMEIINNDILSDEKVMSNDELRCYYCKNAVFGMLKEISERDGYEYLSDGTNASDDPSDRPGMKALEELNILSPLRMCGLTKTEIRKRSKDAGLFTWNKPSYACLATRVPVGRPITKEILENTEKAEGFLFSLGFTDFRVRYADGTAKIQVPSEQMERILKHRHTIIMEFKKFYKDVVLDLKSRDE